MWFQLELDHTFLNYGDESFVNKKVAELKEKYNYPVDCEQIVDCKDSLLLMEPNLVISEWEGYYKKWDQDELDVAVPSLQFQIKYRGERLDSFVIQAEKIILLRDMLDSFLKAYEMRKKILESE